MLAITLVLVCWSNRLDKRAMAEDNDRKVTTLKQLLTDALDVAGEIEPIQVPNLLIKRIRDALCELEYVEKDKDYYGPPQ